MHNFIIIIHVILASLRHGY